MTMDLKATAAGARRTRARWVSIIAVVIPGGRRACCCGLVRPRLSSCRRPSPSRAPMMLAAAAATAAIHPDARPGRGAAAADRWRRRDWPRRVPASPTARRAGLRARCRCSRRWRIAPSSAPHAAPARSDARRRTVTATAAPSARDADRDVEHRDRPSPWPTLGSRPPSRSPVRSRCRDRSRTSRSRWPAAPCRCRGPSRPTPTAPNRTCRRSIATRSTERAIPSRRRSRSAPAQSPPPRTPRRISSAWAASRVSTVTSSRRPWPARRETAGGDRPREYWRRARPSVVAIWPSTPGPVRDGQAERDDAVVALELAHHDRGENARIDIAAAQHQPDALARESASGSASMRGKPGGAGAFRHRLLQGEIGVDGALEMLLVDQHDVGDELADDRQRQRADILHRDAFGQRRRRRSARFSPWSAFQHRRIERRLRRRRSRSPGLSALRRRWRCRRSARRRRSGSPACRDRAPPPASPARWCPARR